MTALEIFALSLSCLAIVAVLVANLFDIRITRGIEVKVDASKLEDQDYMRDAMNSRGGAWYMQIIITWRGWR